MRYPADVICEIHWNVVEKGYNVTLPQILLDNLPLTQQLIIIELIQLLIIKESTILWNSGNIDDAFTKLNDTINQLTNPPPPSTVTITIITNPLNTSTSTTQSTHNSNTTTKSSEPTLSWTARFCRYLSCGSSVSVSSSSRKLSYEERLQLLYMYLKKVIQIVPNFSTLNIGLTVRPYEIYESVSLLTMDNNDDAVQNSPSDTALRVPPSIIFIKVGKNKKFLSSDEIPIFTVPLLRYWENIQIQQMREQQIRRNQKQQQYQRNQRYDSDARNSDDYGLPSPLVLPPPLDLDLPIENNNNNNGLIIEPTISKPAVQVVEQHRTPDTFSIRAPSSPLRAINSSPNNKSPSPFTTKQSILHFLEFFKLGSPRLRSSSMGNSLSRSLSVKDNSNNTGPSISGDIFINQSNGSLHSTIPLPPTASLVSMSRTSSHDNLSNHSLSYHTRPDPSPLNNVAIPIPRVPSHLSLNSDNYTNITTPNNNNNIISPSPSSLVFLTSSSTASFFPVGSSSLSTRGILMNPHPMNPTTLPSTIPINTYSTTNSNTLSNYNYNNTSIGTNNNNNSTSLGTNPVLRIRSPLVPKVSSTNSLSSLDVK